MDDCLLDFIDTLESRIDSLEDDIDTLKSERYNLENALFIKYKGYTSHLKYNAENNIWFGKIENIKDLVNFEATNLEEAINEFNRAVEDYLNFCADIGKEPDKPM